MKLMASKNLTFHQKKIPSSVSASLGPCPVLTPHRQQPLVQTSRNDAAHLKGPKSSNPKQPSIVGEDVFGSKGSNPKQAGVRADPFADLPELIEDDDNYESDQAHEVDVSDFDDLTQEVLAVVISLYRTLICTQEPFPETSIMETKFAQLAWSLACKKTALDVTLSPMLVKMITKRTSHVHEQLKEGSLFTYQDIESRKGIFKSDLIQMSVNEMWFVNHWDEGVVHNKYFDPIPIPTVALVLTVIECCINKWITGIKEDITFSSANYAHIFHDHVNSLMKFNDHTYQYKLLECLRQNLHDTARFHSGAKSLATSKTAPRVSVYAFQEAIHEYEEELDADHDNVQENEYGGNNDVVDHEIGGKDGEEVN
ncbi:hypothetical protein DFH29DRAFT_877762 [Suillus ampliporus]|nr:hypothetical protein DFH29DRAFT_877762 [Suillus ampliporus]